jgi:hypothetical protein
MVQPKLPKDGGGGSMKGNNGRAGRRKLYRRLGVILGSFGTVFFILYLVKSSSPPGTRNVHHTIRNQLRQRFGGEKASSSGNTSDNKDDKDDVLQQILRGEIHLVQLSSDENTVQESDGNSHTGLTGHFCKLEWHLYKENPSSVAMFHHLMAQSPDCRAPRTMDLNVVLQAARAYDAVPENNSIVHTLELTAVVFHESRCGSTLVANMFAAMRPDQHRVYSESPSPLQALTLICGESYQNCSEEAAANMLRDVLYLYSRSNDPSEQRFFIKMQSKGARHLPAFARAFPTTPRIFVYRDPVQVLQSHLKSGSNALCLHQTPPNIVKEAAARHQRHSVDAHHHPEDYCAAHLSSITDAALEGMQDDGTNADADADNNNKMAVPLNYADLPERLYEEIMPGILHLEVGPAELHRIRQVAGQYSKGGGSGAAKGGGGAGGAANEGTFTSDSETKSATASEAVKDAAVSFLEESYEALEEMAAQAKQRFAQL